jgi:hypothetical protein
VLATYWDKAMNEKKLLRQLARLGIDDFETIQDVQRRQRNLLHRLERSSIDPDRYAGLANCRFDYCGRVNCLEVCAVGAFRRRIADVSAALQLLKHAGKPFYEVRVSRAFWSRPFGRLAEAGITAARQLNRRALDRLYNPNVLAVGTFKVAPSPSNDKERWICEVHQVVAGASKNDLERVFSTKQYRGEIRRHKLQLFYDYLMAKEVKTLGPIVSEVLSYHLSGWQHPWQEAMPVDRPNKEQRSEFSEWLLGLDPRARLICYGCDRQFKKLSKKSRPVPVPKAPKKRPYPHWLQPHFFGSHYRQEVMRNDPNCSTYGGPKSKPSPRLDSRLEKYFGDDSDMSYYGDID